MTRTTKVYIQIDNLNNVTKIFSTDFEQPQFDSILVGEGNGDKYRHAQTQFLKKSLINNYGEYNYQYNGFNIVDRGI